MPRGIYQRTQKHKEISAQNAKIARSFINNRGSDSSSWKGGKPNCSECGRELSKRGIRFCLKHRQPIRRKPYWTEESRRKISIAQKGKILSTETRKKISESKQGEKHWNWKPDRSQLKKKQERNDSAYQVWRLEVYKRDNYKCKMNNQDCSGRIIAHHILGWSKFPELRYQINNGITLCQAHHPRKRAEEKRLSPYFQGLVLVSKV